MARDWGLSYETMKRKRAQHEGWWQAASCVLREETIQAALGEMQTLKQENENRMSGGEPQAPILLQGGGGP